MKFRKADITPLYRTQKSLFRYTKQGIIMDFNYQTINLTERFTDSPSDVIDMLEGFLEKDLIVQYREDIKEVLNDFKDEYNLVV